MGVLDAVSGQAITLPAGKFAALKLLATGVNGNQTAQTFTVTYTDGTTSSFAQNLSDWCTPQNFSGETNAVPGTYRDNSTGTIDVRTLYLYGYADQSLTKIQVSMLRFGRAVCAVTRTCRRGICSDCIHHLPKAEIALNRLSPTGLTKDPFMRRSSMFHRSSNAQVADCRAGGEERR